MAALAAAPRKAAALNNLAEGMRSGRLSTAANAVPQTNPSWTTVVSQAPSEVVSPQMALSWGVTALAVKSPEMTEKMSADELKTLAAIYQQLGKS